MTVDSKLSDLFAWHLFQAAVERLTRHRDAWQELCRDLRRTVVQHEHELKERWIQRVYKWVYNVGKTIIIRHLGMVYTIYLW